MKNKKNIFNQKGQAALMDSIFFLTIIATICTTLFFFAINYGSTTSDQINSFYSRDFANDSLKVVSYINVSREGKSLDEINASNDYAQLDYLLALIKEDYADKQEISEKTTTAIARTLNDVMLPFDSAIDYAFFMVNESDEDYLFLLLATHQCDETIDLDNDGLQDCIDPNVERDDDLIQRKYFYCEPLDNQVLEKQIYPKLNKIDSAFGKVTFSESFESQSQGRPFVLGLSVWVTSDIPELKEDNLTNSSDFNCSIVDIN